MKDDGALATYWLRTLKLFKGEKVLVRVADGRERVGVMTDTPAGPRLFTEQGMAVLPLGEITGVEAV